MVNSAFCGGSFWLNNGSTHSPSLPVIEECYRRSVIAWIPPIFFWLMMPAFVLYTRRFKKRTFAKTLNWNYFILSKFALTIFAIAVSITLFVLTIVGDEDYEKPSGGFYQISYQYTVIWIITFGGILGALYLCKQIGILTSGILHITWILFSVCSLPEVYAIAKHEHASSVLGTTLFLILFSTFVLQAILFSFSDSSARGKVETGGYASPELYSSFLGRITYWWFNSLAMYGAKTDLTMDTLYDLNDGSTSSVLEKLWFKYWTPQIEEYYRLSQIAEKERSGKLPIPPSIFYALFKMFRYELISASLFKAFSDILQFANPFVLNLLISFVSDKKSPLWVGIAYAILMFLFSELRSLCLNHYFYIMFRLGTKIQTALTAATYRKTLKLSNVARKNKTVGEIVNLMAIDVERYQMATFNVQILWSGPFQVILCLTYLVKTLGPTALVGALVMILFVIINYFSSIFVRKWQVAQMKYKDERVKLCNEVLNGIKVVKLYAWELPLCEMIEKIRKAELKKIRQASVIKAFLDTFNQSSGFLVAFFSFAAYTLSDPEKNKLTPQVAFVSLVLFNLLRSPITMLGLLINQLVQLSVSNSRLKEFLAADEIKQDSIVKVTDEKRIDHLESAISIERGTFSWDNDYDSKSNINGVNLDIEKGNLVAIIGRVGSGKSSLISAMLGEMNKMSGTVNINGTIAYASQQPWIQNISLRDNILFGSPYKAHVYDRVIEACALKSDLETLPDGDLTEIGEKGINLSGGQKSRIGLAVACYSNHSICILDDPLSAVDSHVGKHIFDHVIGPTGILRNKTRILVTNNTALLDKVDLIIMMEDSKIKRIGRYETLLNDPSGVFANFIMGVEKDNESEDTSSEPIELDNISTISDIFETKKNITMNDLREKKTEGALMSTETTETGNVKFTVYLDYFKATGYFFAIFFAVGYLGYNGVQLFRSLWLASWSNANDIGNNGEPRNDTVSLGERLSVYGGLGIMESLAFVLSMTTLIFGGLNASKRLHTPLLINILHSPMEFFDTTPIGRILNRFGKDVDVVDSQLPLSFRYFVMCLCQILVSLTLIVATIPIFAAVIPFLVIIYWYSYKFYVATSRGLKRIESANRSPIYTHFGQTVLGAPNIRAYGKTEDFTEMSDTKIDTFMRSKYLSNVANRWLAIRLEFIGSCILVFSVLFAAVSKELDWITSTGVISLSITYSMNITEVLNFAVRQISELETNIICVERLSEYTKLPNEPTWRTDKGSQIKNWPSKGEIRFVNYSTRYREGLDLVIKNISAFIKGGEKVALVGRTGSGKSSLSLGLFRMIEAAEGKILIDDVDISEIGLHDLRETITIIPQDPVCFSADLRFNLDPFDRYTDDQIWEALEHAHLKEFVTTKLDRGLESKISEGGSNWSTGQRQLLCLARAILRRSKILVLDEATANIDNKTDALIQETIRKEFASSTILTIAHRINTILDYDRVMVMDQGEIGEFDTPAALLSNKQSVFFSLAQDAGLA
uniref:Multidrug resistance-associated protein 1 n=1 Tax=Rhabditophanes sp. KR3021 TaxID=114890 RepID=A0AC35TJK4_9BILA